MIEIHQALTTDAGTITDMLIEAASWVDALGVEERHHGVPGDRVMWSEGELEPDAIGREVAAGQFIIARVNGVPAGAIRFQGQDLLFWPDIPQDDSVFVHRLVVRRAFKKQGVSQALLAWSLDRARVLGKRFLRLDCDADRAKLRSLYERAGFRFHSYRQVGPYYVARYEHQTG